MFRILASVLSTLLLSYSAVGMAGTAPSDPPAVVEDWYPIASEFNSAPSQSVEASIIWDDGTGESLVIGGWFKSAGGKLVKHVARWDGTSWVPFGTGLDGPVYAFAVDANGHLIAAGRFDRAGDAAVSNVARWDGGRWHTLGTGVGGTVLDITIDLDGNIIAAGYFEHAGAKRVNRIARWDGMEWHNLGEGLNNTVRAVAVDSLGQLYAGGDFTAAGFKTATRIAMWDGNEWQSMGDGLDGSVREIVAHPEHGLVIGGHFLHSGDAEVEHVAQWDGMAWAPIPGGPNGEVFKIEPRANGSLLVLGQFNSLGEGIYAHNVAAWNGLVWSTPLTGERYMQTVSEDASGTVYVGGAFATIARSPIARIARWDGAQWQPMGRGLNDEVKTVTATEDGLYIGGWFAEAEDAGSGRIATWRDGQWQSLGTGYHPYGGVNSIVRPSEGFVVATGWYPPDVASWDGMQWSSLSTRIENGHPSVLAQDLSGNIYLGGDFTSVDGVAANSIAVFSNRAWSPLGDGVDGGIRAMAIDASGDLIAGGDFAQAGTVQTASIARWDGVVWHALGQGLPSVRAIATGPNGELYAAGSFEGPDRIAAWNGTQWNTIPSELSIEGSGGLWISALALNSDGTLIASGAFNRIDGVDAYNIARWDGANWAPMGSADDNSDLARNAFSSTFSINSIAIAADGDVIVGSGSTDFGETFSPYVAGFGAVESTQTLILDVTAGAEGVPTALTAAVTGVTAPASGLVSFMLSPGGACTDLELTSVDETISEAACDVLLPMDQKYSVTAIYSGGNDGTNRWRTSTAEPVEFILGVIDQFINFEQPAAQTYAPMKQFPLVVEATSGLLVDLASATPGICSVDNSLATILDVGDCMIAANQAGDEHHRPAPEQTLTVTIDKGPQTIDLTVPFAQATYGETTSFEVMASASSGLDVVLSTTTPSCEISGTTVTVVSAGPCTVAADQPGSSLYLAADTVVATVEMLKAVQTIELLAPETVMIGSSAPVTASASSGLPVELVSLTPSVCTLSEGQLLSVSPGLCRVRADQSGDDSYEATSVEAMIEILGDLVHGDGFEPVSME